MLEKDVSTIDTLLSKKTKTRVQLYPFKDEDELVELDIYNDINILFGSKGTGKTVILEALSRYYNEIGHKTNVYVSSLQNILEEYDIKGLSIEIDLAELNIDDCKAEFEMVRGAEEKEVTSLSKYLAHFMNEEKNKIAQKLKIQNITSQDDSKSERKLTEIKGFLDNFSQFEKYVKRNPNLYNVVDENLLDDLKSLLGDILSQLTTRTESRLLDANSVKMLNSIIEFFSNEITRKTGAPQKPGKTGFVEYSRNRIGTERAVNKIISNVNKLIEEDFDYVGSLGAKGDLFCKTSIVIQNGDFANTSYTPLMAVNKKPQKYTINGVKTFQDHLYSDDLFEKIAKLNEVEGIDTISDLYDLLQFQRYFVLNDQPYIPSTGESSMLLLHKELNQSKDIFIIDEPEKSLGNDYINEQIVPLLKEKAKMNKVVVIATHDANIAVRTLPYSSIYRLHKANNKCFTFAGNPFANNLTCLNGDKDDLDWKEISMKTLEGGKDAFGERSKIYGNK